MEGCWFTSSANPNPRHSSCKSYQCFWERRKEVFYLNFLVTHRAFFIILKLFNFYWYEFTSLCSLDRVKNGSRGTHCYFTFSWWIIEDVSHFISVWVLNSSYFSGSFPLCTMYVGTRMCKCHSHPIQDFHWIGVIGFCTSICKIQFPWKPTHFGEQKNKMK